MKKATLTETKNRLSALIDEVRAGETILVLDRGRPVARIESILADEQGASVGRLERLERQGLVTRPKAPVSRKVLEKSPPRPRRGAHASKRLAEERAAGR